MEKRDNRKSAGMTSEYMKSLEQRQGTGVVQYTGTSIMGEVPEFQLGKPRYTQETFIGRLRHFLDLIDPRTLFTSQAKLDECIRLLEEYKQGTLSSKVSNAQLWEAQKIKQAIIHPDTGQKIFMPFRMSGFVPFGSITVIGLLLPNQTLGQMTFWQWINQTHNACVNYSNRNATKPTPTKRFVTGYIGAVTSAVAIALSLSVLIRRANNLSPTMKLIVQKFVPFPAVATASVSNVVLMRNSELAEGIEVMDANHKVVGTSRVAARKALKETAMTRAVLPAPILIIPPIIMTFMERTSLLKKYPKLHLPINATAATLCFGLALPVCIAMFPQISQIKRSALEKSIQENCDDEVLYYNKGL